MVIVSGLPESQRPSHSYSSQVLDHNNYRGAKESLKKTQNREPSLRTRQRAASPVLRTTQQGNRDVVISEVVGSKSVTRLRNDHIHARYQVACWNCTVVEYESLAYRLGAGPSGTLERIQFNVECLTEDDTLPEKKSWVAKKHDRLRRMALAHEQQEYKQLRMSHVEHLRYNVAGSRQTRN